MLIFTSCINNNPSDEQPRTHDYNIGETSGYIVKDGATSYKIVIPENAGAIIKTAAEELRYFFLQATGIELLIIKDNDISYSENAKYLSIGDNLLLESAGITIDKKLLGTDGFRIITKGNSVFMFGGGDYGSLYSVYEFLHQAFSYEYYYKDCYTLDKNVRELKLMAYNITDVPDIAKRTANYGFIKEDIMVCNRLRLRPVENYIISVGKIWHNSFLYFDSNTKDTHPDFYSADGKQLCYTAHGNSEEYALMTDIVAQKIIEKRKEFPSLSVITMTMEDNMSSCSCSACSALLDKYGAASAAVIIFMNDVNAKVKAWFDTPEGKNYDPNLDILFFAYNKYTNAPAIYNKDTKEYEAIDGLKCSDGVSVLYAPISSNFTRSLYDADNSATYNTMKAWRAVSKKIYLWLYSTNFSFYLIPFNSFNGMQDNYKFAVEMGTEFLIDQAQVNQKGSATGWSLLKAYLNAKLAWNSSINYQQLVDNFFNAMYGEAAPFMREYFERYKTLASFNEKFMGFGGNIYFNALDQKFWPKQELLVWRNCIDKALDAIDYLKIKDIKLYNSYYEHIIAERISINYLLVQLYNSNITPEELMDFKLEFKEDVSLLKLTRSSEGGNIIDLFSSWGL
jgi:hypothetical protein